MSIIFYSYIPWLYGMNNNNDFRFCLCECAFVLFCCCFFPCYFYY